MILVDTTVWIDFFLGKPCSYVVFLEKAINDNENLCVNGVILSEILQGIRSEKDYKKTKAHFESLIYLPILKTTYISAADIYRSLRKKGITIRNTIDCVIAANAMEHNIPLLHNDKDFDNIEKNSGLKTIYLL